MSCKDVIGNMYSSRRRRRETAVCKSRPGSNMLEDYIQSGLETPTPKHPKLSLSIGYYSNRNQVYEIGNKWYKVAHSLVHPPPLHCAESCDLLVSAVFSSYLECGIIGGNASVNQLEGLIGGLHIDFVLRSHAHMLHFGDCMDNEGRSRRVTNFKVDSRHGIQRGTWNEKPSPDLENLLRS
jgi:hypothetical protein